MDSCTRPNVNICPVCGVDKEKGSKLYGHLFDAHDYTKAKIEDLKRVRRTGKVLTTGKPVISCGICGSCFTTSSAYSVHQRRKHPEGYKGRTILCPLCDAEMSNHYGLIKHARMSHATKEDDYTVKTLTFKSPQEYKEWRERTEKANMIKHFISSSDASNGVRTIRLRCSRALRSLNHVPKKTRKTVAYCTAYMKVVEAGENINVEYCLTHCCHDISPAKSNQEQFRSCGSRSENHGVQENCKTEPFYIEDYVEDAVPPRRRSKGNSDKARDALREIEMAYTEIHSAVLALSSRCSHESLQLIQEVANRMTEDSKTLTLKLSRTRLLGEENAVGVARRAEVSKPVRSRESTIRKTKRASALRRCEQTKRTKADNDC